MCANARLCTRSDHVITLTAQTVLPEQCFGTAEASADQGWMISVRNSTRRACNNLNHVIKIIARPLTGRCLAQEPRASRRHDQSFPSLRALHRKQLWLATRAHLPQTNLGQLTIFWTSLKCSRIVERFMPQRLLAARLIGPVRQQKIWG